MADPRIETLARDLLGYSLELKVPLGRLRAVSVGSDSRDEARNGRMDSRDW